MKKLVFLVLAIFITGILAPVKVDAKPFWIKFKLGIFAKWSVTFNGECEDGWGLCIAFLPVNAPPSAINLLGYDDETDKLTLKVSKQWTSADSFSKGSYEIKEDSQVDPKLIESMTNFKSRNKSVFVIKGTYSVKDDGSYYILSPDYKME